MSPITIQGLGVSFSTCLFQDVTFSFGDGDRIGVVANNGAGKSTLLRCIAGLQEPTEGSITRPRNIRMAYVEQVIPDRLLPLTLREAVLDSLPANERDDNGWRADILLDTFGAPDDMRDRKLSALSGGWQRLAVIGRAWIQTPDVLIIDEPTNHLDLHKIMFLENWLNEEIKDTALIIVSHDRRFLETCTNRTLFLRPKESKLYRYPFLRARELLDEDDRAIQNKMDRELKEMQRLRKSAHNLRQIGVNNFSAAALRKSIQIAKRADTIEEALPDAHVEERRDIKLASRGSHADRVIGIKDLTVTRPDGAPLFHIGELDVYKGDRLVVLGRNGTGKTQFIKRLLLGFADLHTARTEGLAIAPSVIMGYVDQNLIQLPDSDIVREHIRKTGKCTEERATGLLISAGFSISQQLQRISVLSPGQKARLALLSLRLVEPSFYLMDEPTNHLDIAGQEQFETEILNHVVSAVLVSHDRAFVENLGNRFIVIENSQVIEIDSPALFYQALAADAPISKVAPRFNPI